MKEVDVKYTKIFINNEWHTSVSGKTFPTINPTTGSKVADVQEADAADVDIAVNAARAAMECNAEWRQMDASDRGRLIFKLADLMERDAEELAILETMDNGRLITSTKADVEESIKVFRYYAGYADKIHGKTIPMDGKCFGYTRREPVGVCGQIVPWNYPILMATWKLSTAFAAGCVSILKPAEQTPLTALKMAALVQEAGFPPGVLAVLPGYGPTAGAALAEHPKVDKIAFTGSTEVGRLVASEASRTSGKRVSLEMGGKSPLVIMDDAEINYAVGLAQAVVFENMGQCCVAGTRTFVHDKIYDEFVKKSIAIASARVLGNPLDENTTHGPQIDGEQEAKIIGLIESGKQEGAKLELGGEKAPGSGFFIKPTIFSNVADDMRIAKEEIFGPVQAIFRFSTLDEAIRRANNTNYGLGAGIITQNIDAANRFVQEVQAGTVWVNTYLESSPHAPFGGYKDSGHGRELGEDGLEEYLETKTVITKLPSKCS